MDKVVLYIENGNIVDRTGYLILAGYSSLGVFVDEYEEPKTDITKLVSLGCSPDDLIKMNACGLL